MKLLITTKKPSKLLWICRTVQTIQGIQAYHMRPEKASCLGTYTIAQLEHFSNSYYKTAETAWFTTANPVLTFELRLSKA